MMAYLPYIKTMLTKDTPIIAIKNYKYMATIFFNRRQKVSKVGKTSDFSYFIIFCCVKVNAWLSSHTVCKIGLIFYVCFGGLDTSKCSVKSKKSVAIEKKVYKS
jgi:hypothetical protein